MNAAQNVADRRVRSAAQVAINWCSCKGVIPMSGARSREQVLEVLGGYHLKEEREGGREESDEMIWKLTESEMNELQEDLT